ncbi:MAG: hypothetical protein HYU64_02420 [Armatimonadetes bacterium]|nr:hypothetical protein [Armatimonadota bacterium]
MSSSEKLVLRNQDVVRCLLGTPEGHSHMRALLETADGKQIFLQEATLANITRAYVTLKTHPVRKALELVLERVENPKEGFAHWQVLESSQEDEEILRRLAEAM